MENKNKKEIMTEEQKLNLLQLAVFCAVGCVGTFTGFFIGQKATEKAIGKGWEMCWEHDPTLKDHMQKVILDIAKKS